MHISAGCRAELLGLGCSSAELIDPVTGNEIKSLLCLIIPETELVDISVRKEMPQRYLSVRWNSRAETVWG